MILSDVILPDVTMLLRVMLGLGVSVVSDAEHYPGGNGITSDSMTTGAATGGDTEVTDNG